MVGEYEEGYRESKVISQFMTEVWKSLALHPWTLLNVLIYVRGLFSFRGASLMVRRFS